MLLHHKFIQNAKRLGEKLAIKDKGTGKELSFTRALIASLILGKKFSKYDKGFLGVMVPSTAGCALTVLGALMSGRTPVMINYSTGAAENCRYAQRKCDFKTIITSRALLEKIECPEVEGMIYLEDIMAGLSAIDKIKAAITSKLPEAMLLKAVAGGSDEDNAVILFTSGSEKDPKAVQRSHGNISSNIESVVGVYGLVEDDIMLSMLPFFHVLG